MNTITSSEFRKTYPKLKEPTIVSVLGYAIGVWMPAPPVTQPAAVEAFKAFEPPRSVVITAVDFDSIPPIVPARKAQQAERDRILSRVNRGG